MKIVLLSSNLFAEQSHWCGMWFSVPWLTVLYEHVNLFALLFSCTGSLHLANLCTESDILGYSLLGILLYSRFPGSCQMLVKLTYYSPTKKEIALDTPSLVYICLQLSSYHSIMCRDSSICYQSKATLGFLLHPCYNRQTKNPSANNYKVWCFIT